MKLRSRHWLLGAGTLFAMGVGCSGEDPSSPNEESFDNAGEQPNYPSDGGASSSWEEPDDPHQQPDQGRGGDGNGDDNGTGASDGVGGGSSDADCAGATSFEVNLSGDDEVPPADLDGSGSALITLNCSDGQLCFDLKVTNVSPITAAHVHEGAAGTNGPVLVNFGAHSDENEFCPLNEVVPALFASDGAPGNGFGRALAVENGTAFVGANDGAYVFVGSGQSWDETQKLTCQHPDFGLAVALSGSHAAVSSADAVNIYDLVDGVWVEVQKLTPPDADAQDFGTALAISGDTLLVGAPNDLLDSDNFGSVYVFERSGSTWSETARLRPGVNLGGFSCFGCAVALRGDLALVGAPDAFPPTTPGALFSFERQGSIWEPGPSFPASTTAGGHFGAALAISSSTVLVGAPGEQVFEGPNLIGFGAVHPFGRDGNQWVPEGVAPSSRTPQNALLPEVVGLDTQFGASVATFADFALVGAPGLNAAHLFTRSAGVWAEDDVLRLPGGVALEFGTTVAVQDGTFMVGAPGGTEKEGAVFLYGPEGDSDRGCNVVRQRSQGCVPTNPDTLNAISQNPAGYYVNVHTQDFPDGAVRGQLGD